MTPLADQAGVFERTQSIFQYNSEAQKMTTSSYLVTLTDEGKWLHAAGSDFLFAYIPNEWDASTQKAVANAFEIALGMSTAIKNAVKETSGQDAVNGLYLLDQAAMTKAMNSIPGMGETSVDQQSEQGNGTAIEINKEFFAAVLAGLGGDVEPLLTYLTEEMENVQVQTKKSTVAQDFGTIVGLISVMEGLNIPVTTFQYLYSSAKTSAWFVKVNCGSAEHYSYEYKYTVVNYNYDPN